MSTVHVTLLRTALEHYFKDRGRVHLGAAFIRHYQLLRDGELLLEKPVETAVQSPELARTLASMPLGRAVTMADFGERAEGNCLPVLEECTAALLNRSGWELPRLYSACLGANYLNAVPGSKVYQTLRLALRNVSFPYDYAGVVRVARLLAAHRQMLEVTVEDLAAACLLLLPINGWLAVHRAVRENAGHISALLHAYSVQRQELDELDPSAYQTLWNVAIFARDELLPLPTSGSLHDVRLAEHVVVEWPASASCNLLIDPFVDAMPGIGADFLISQILAPTAARRNLPCSPVTSRVSPYDVQACVGRYPASGGWEAVLTRAAQQTSSAAAEQVIAHLFPPATAVTSTATYGEMLTQLRSQVVGHEPLLRELALLCDSRFAEAGAPVRALLIGPSGSGKTTILSSLAEASGRVFVRIDASQISEHGYKGLQAADVARMIWRAAGKNLTLASKAIVLLDEIDKQRTTIPLPGGDPSSGSATDVHGATVRAGRQEAMLALLDTGQSVITFTSEEDGGVTHQLSTRGLIIVAAGAFRGIQMAGVTPSDDELSRYGFIPEFVSRLGIRLSLSAPDIDLLQALYTNGPDAVKPAIASCKAMGFDLFVAPEAVRLVSVAVAQGRGGLTPRTGASIIGAAARRALLSALTREHDPDPQLTIGPDDVLPLLPDRMSLTLKENA